MATSIQGLSERIILVLYDYMLTSDHESFWFSIPTIQDAFTEEVPGAFIERALKSLISRNIVEQGGSNLFSKDLFALTELGIKQAEAILVKAGIAIEDYEPAPSADVILTRVENPEQLRSLEDGFESLRKQVVNSNSATEILDEDKVLFTSELDAAKTLVGAERVRVSRLNGLILPTLRYLAEKFRDQAIGEAAKRLIQLLVGLL